MSTSSTTTNLMNKWKIDLTIGGSKISTRHIETGLNPPGYESNFTLTSSQSEGQNKNDSQQQHLLSKRAWDMALGPVKSLPMNMFMMYMAGNTISIFPIMMVAMMVWRPIKALMSVGGVFKPIEAEHNGSLIVHKIIFAFGNIGAIALAVYKCHSMGLLPNHASDWLDFALPPERLQYSLIGDTFI
uniref:ER membrane protein complex subunit 4 n=1 Tax=Panagrolaimus sp. JU765 TaxID=591449 RepID=A0AC34Q7T1_9BILA